MRPAFPASDYYEGSATRPALAEGWPTPLPESRTCFPSSTRLHLHAVLGPACTPGTARCRARHRRMPIKGSTASLPKQGCLCKEETEIPTTPPSPYRERVVHGATLQSAVPFVTITALWLAARGVVGWPPPHCREGFRHDSASGPRACFPSHRPTPGRVPHLERLTYALLGAPPLTLSDGEDLAIGSELYLVGYPAEMELFPQPTITSGILSRLREWERAGITYFQTDAAIAGGQSGGVLVDARANVIGISGWPPVEESWPDFGDYLLPYRTR